MDRIYSRADYLALKTATKEAVEACGPITETAKRTRLDAGTISRAGNPNESNFIPLDVALDLDSLSGDAKILRAYAALLGFELVRRKSEQAITKEIISQAGDVAEQSGDLVSETIKAAADGSLTPAEAKRIDGEAADLERTIRFVRKTTHQVMAGEAA